MSDQIPTVRSWSNTSIYIHMLTKSVIDDIRPLVDLPGHAPFAICREVLSYVDHLGHLYSGRGGQGEVGKRTQRYMKEVMGTSPIDPHYAERATELYQMFRCGPIHEFKPKTLENKKGELLTWLCYDGGRKDTIKNCPTTGQNLSVVHLEPVAASISNCFWLPVSTRCLIEDLIASIEAFEKAGPENERITAWNRASRDLNPPRAQEFAI